MTTCCRIFGAYSFRLTKRHSTFFLFICFIVTLTLILQLYAYKTSSYFHSTERVGEFDYKPGAFLRGQQPNENVSYCDFNYGLPHILEWNQTQVLYPPEMGALSPYRVIYNAIKGTEYQNCTKQNAVTYATQATPEFIYHIVEIARFWDGPISLAVFVPDYDLDIAMQIMTQLCHCYPGMSKVSLHLFYPRHHPPQINMNKQTSTTEAATTIAAPEEILQRKVEKYRNLNNKTRNEYIETARKNKIKRMMVKLQTPQAPILNFEDCSGLDTFDIPTYRKQKSMLYLINVGRNVARNASRTNYFIVSDIEMVPSEQLAHKFLKMIRRIMSSKKYDEGFIFSKTAFVVPLFEVERGEDIPRDKATLVSMVTSNRATYFHQKVCPHCQRFPGLQTWLLTTNDEVEPMWVAHREYPYHRWEPLYFGTNKDPWYSEQLSWEGKQEKMTQMLELCLLRYRLIILDGAFLCHAASTKQVNKYHGAQMKNTKLYTKIISSLKDRYPKRAQCKSNYMAILE